METWLEQAPGSWIWIPLCQAQASLPPDPPASLMQVGLAQVSEFSLSSRPIAASVTRLDERHPQASLSAVDLLAFVPCVLGADPLAAESALEL